MPLFFRILYIPGGNFLARFNHKVRRVAMDVIVKRRLGPLMDVQEKESHSDVGFHVFSSDPYHCHAGKVTAGTVCLLFRRGSVGKQMVSRYECCEDGGVKIWMFPKIVVPPNHPF